MSGTIEKCGDVTLKTEIVDDVSQSKDAHKGLTDSQICELKTAFSMLDKNKDGRVNLSELKAMLNNLGICIEDCIVEALIKQASDRGSYMDQKNIHLVGAYSDIGTLFIFSVPFRMVDRGDGLVNEEEFLDWMANQEEIGGQEDDIMDDLLAAFRVFDKDGNGYITRDELKMAMDLIGETVTEAQLDEMLRASDIDHDGRINYEEFVKILL